MMKNWMLLCLPIVMVAGVAFSQDPTSQDSLDKRVEVLEQDLTAARRRSSEIAAELAETKTVLAATLRYLDVQAKAAATLSTSLDESEKAGFTFGINPDSRHILLRGWREALGTLQKDVPVMPVPKTTAPKPTFTTK